MGDQDSRRLLDRPRHCRLSSLLLLLPWLWAPLAGADSFGVLSQNMNRLFDDIDDGNQEEILARRRFHQRIKSAAKTFGKHFGLPQIIALQEVENLNVLRQIASQIQDRYHAAYRPVLLPGQDVSGINVAFLVHFDLTIRKVEQLFANATFKLTGTPLFSRPPLYLEACISEKCISFINLHLRSMRGIDSNQDGDRVARKRLQQAETIAVWVQGFQQTRPGDSLMLLGDFNALTPADKHVDVAGILRGAPDNRSARLPARDLIEIDLVDLSRLIAPEQRYSYLFRQRQQQLDYMLVNQGFAADVESIAFGRIDRRFSDHAGLLARFHW
jgi:endonuclease/exonuclease/phosphatase family metal-dependent hydrolase